MTIILKEGIDRSSGRREFYLAGLEMRDDFDGVLQSLGELKNLSTFERVEGIYSRIGKFEMGEVQFQVVYHEDVGVYAFSTDDNISLTNNCATS
jgi:hypothetical protein